jgi:hypothetical protein
MKRTLAHEIELAKQINELLAKEDVNGVLDLVRRNKCVEIMNGKR